MNDRVYFLLGDVTANVAVGAVAGFAAALVTSPDWWMLPAMVVGMVVGMAVATVAAVPFMRWFGALEVMVPTMLGGMLAGMVVSMADAMHGLGAVAALRYGALAGLTAWALSSYADYLVRGNASMYRRDGHGS